MLLLNLRPVNAWNDTQKINWTSPEWPVNGLVEGEPHVFQVAACNILGCGQISDNSSTYVAKAAGKHSLRKRDAKPVLF